MSCRDALSALSVFSACEETTAGSRIQTHCLYPSFEGVSVFITKVGDGFIVTDGGEAFSNAWAHGRDDLAIGRMIDAECRRFRLTRGNGNTIVARVESAEWLLSSILAVANASSCAATAAVSKFAASIEDALSDRIEQSLRNTFGAKAIGREHEVQGRSGGLRHFDFVVKGQSDRELLINAVASHHSSIFSRYVAFADTEFPRDHKLAVFDQPLSKDDASLLAQVAITLPLASLSQGAERAMAHT